ncbi:STX16 family protein [Megaselia abdita]
MTSRNLTEVFMIMRNNATKHRHLYADLDADTDGEKLLKRSLHDAEEGLEMRDDCSSPPVWIDKLEEALYTMSKLKPKLDELGSLHARHLLKPAFDENTEDEEKIEFLGSEISKLITSTHRHIQCIRSSLEIGSKMDQLLTKNVVTYLLLSLQELTYKFRNSQSNYINQISSREERSNQYFKTSTNFETIELDDRSSSSGFASGQTNVETFDNFLQPKSSSSTKDHYYDDGGDDALDEDFQRPVTSRMTQQQLLLFEEENSKMAQHREEEVNKIVKSIADLHDIFKDLSHMVQEQGTVLDRIDYNVEQVQTRVSEGLRQLQRAELYQRKNRKMMAIVILAGITLFMLTLLIFTKF